MENISEAFEDVDEEVNASISNFLENFDTNDPLLPVLLEELFKILKE